MRRDRVGSTKYKDRSNEILFIDARNLGHLINRRTKVLSDEDIKLITDTYHNWRNQDGVSMKTLQASVLLYRLRKWLSWIMY